jgi:zinc ribbon protein
MTTCPHCAAQIQAGARTCDSCGRDVLISHPPTPDATTDLQDQMASWHARRPTLLWVTVGVLVLVVLAGGVFRPLLLRPNGASGFVGRLLPAAPHVDVIDDNAALDIPGGSANSWTWHADAARPDCRVTGRVLGIAGGERDIDVLIMSHAEYASWTRHRPVHPSFESGPQSLVILDQTVKDTGTYHLVISNAASVSTHKVVQTQGLRVTCS